jgi:hypothetical protein
MDRMLNSKCQHPPWVKASSETKASMTMACRGSHQTSKHKKIKMRAHAVKNTKYPLYISYQPNAQGKNLWTKKPPNPLEPLTPHQSPMDKNWSAISEPAPTEHSYSLECTHCRIVYTCKCSAVAFSEWNCPSRSSAEPWRQKTSHWPCPGSG